MKLSNKKIIIMTIKIVLESVENIKEAIELYLEPLQTNLGNSNLK